MDIITIYIHMFIQTFIMHKVTSQIKSVSVFIEDILSQESNGYLSNYAYIQDLAYAAPTEISDPAALPSMALVLDVFGIVHRRNKAKAIF